jgi:protein TonB
VRRLLIVLVASWACAKDGNPPAATPAESVTSRNYDPPAATNAESPVHYPARLYDQSVEGTVMLRLYVTATGTVVAESTRVAESSGYAALDSAAVAGVPAMTFAPARRDGQPVAAAFLQPVYFRHVDKRGRGTGRP